MAGERMKEEDAVAATDAAAVFCKNKILSARRRRQELMRIRSDKGGGGSETKRIRNVSDPEAAGDGGSVLSVEETAGEGGGHVRGSACSSYGHVSVVGRRREMEDVVAVVPGMAGGWLDFFGVYDGHGGAQVAVACSKRMHVVLDDVAGGDWPDGGNERWREVMGECFGRVDVEAGEAAYRTVGSTAVVALVGPTNIVVANCGDSRAVLSRDGLAVPLSQDHKPNRPDEMERVEAAGGRVINWGGYRIIGVLATSRSIGDYYLKPYVISEPEVTITDRTEKDEFLILASDGLWDVISNEMACKSTRQCLNGRAARMFPHVLSGSSASEAAAFLAELAMARGSKDNISVVVVNLKRFSSESSS